jgi:hypothetical protein
MRTEASVRFVLTGEVVCEGTCCQLRGRSDWARGIAALAGKARGRGAADTLAAMQYLREEALEVSLASGVRHDGTHCRTRCWKRSCLSICEHSSTRRTSATSITLLTCSSTSAPALGSFAPGDEVEAGRCEAVGGLRTPPSGALISLEARGEERGWAVRAAWRRAHGLLLLLLMLRLSPQALGMLKTAWVQVA